MSSKIKSIKARQIIDSRGNPTVEADVLLEDGAGGRAAVPSGASTGEHEAVELRDGGKDFGGQGVQKAVGNIKAIISPAVIGMDAVIQTAIDDKLRALDGTDNFSKLGANAVLAISLATAHAAAASRQTYLFDHIASLAGNTDIVMPMPMMNIINGGAHAAGSSDIQEFMIVPVGAEKFSDCIRIGSEIFHSLKKVIGSKGYATTVGDEGGFAPSLKGGNEEALQLIEEAVSQAGYELGTDVVLALDVAASEFYESGSYSLKTEDKKLSSQEMIDWLVDLRSRYPITLIEDGLDENDWENWSKLTARIGSNTQIVGDDLLVTNTTFLKRAIEEKSANAILIKPNQIGTLTQTIDAVIMAQKAGWNTIISHRSGETEDTTIAHIAVGLGAGQIKTGSLSRTDRVAKYNELLRIEEALENHAKLSKVKITD